MYWHQIGRRFSEGISQNEQNQVFSYYMIHLPHILVCYFHLIYIMCESNFCKVIQKFDSHKMFVKNVALNADNLISWRYTYFVRESSRAAMRAVRALRENWRMASDWSSSFRISFSSVSPEWATCISSVSSPALNLFQHKFM